MIFFREYCHLIHPVEKLDFKPERKSGSSLQTWLELNELNECILLFILVYRPVPVPYLWCRRVFLILCSQNLHFTCVATAYICASNVRWVSFLPRKSTFFRKIFNFAVSFLSRKSTSFRKF
jgi:hypothetical protein